MVWKFVSVRRGVGAGWPTWASYIGESEELPFRVIVRVYIFIPVILYLIKADNKKKNKYENSARQRSAGWIKKNTVQKSTE